MLVAFDQYVFVVNILDDDVVVMLRVDFDDDGLDGWVALYQNACLSSA